MSAILTGLANDLARIFRVTCPRWAFTVTSITPISWAICLFWRPGARRGPGCTDHVVAFGLEQRTLANHTYTPPQPNGYSETLDELLAEGRHGVMSRKGFFDWEGRSPEELSR